MRDPGDFAHLDPFATLTRGFDGILRDAKKVPDKDDKKGGPQETPKAGPKATETDSARVTKTPTPKQIKEINAHVQRANQLIARKDKDAAIKEAQLAIDKVVKYYGIDTSSANSVTYEWGNFNRGGHTYSADRRVVVNTPGLIDAPSLAGTVVHEVTHTNQIKAHGPNEGTDMDVLWQNHYAREAMGYQAALSDADKIGLSEKKKQWYAQEVQDAKSKLSPANLKRLESGQYWGMKGSDAKD